MESARLEVVEPPDGRTSGGVVYEEGAARQAARRRFHTPRQGRESLHSPVQTGDRGLRHTSGSAPHPTTGQGHSAVKGPSSAGRLRSPAGHLETGEPQGRRDWLTPSQSSQVRGLQGTYLQNKRAHKQDPSLEVRPQTALPRDLVAKGRGTVCLSVATCVVQGSQCPSLTPCRW